MYDTSLTNIQQLYPVKNVFKKRQKSSSGRLIPFESIDKSLYKKQANCVCFITSNGRIHAWISVLAERLCNQLGSTPEYDVSWKDQKENECTEFRVHDGRSVSASSDDFLYKVIVYLSTGKIMIQGKAYEYWCSQEFLPCLETVNEINKVDLPSDDETFVKELDLACNSNEADRGQLLDNETVDINIASEAFDSVPEQQVDLGEKIQANSDSCPVSDESTQPKENTGNVKDDRHEHIIRRLDVFEDALVNISNSLSQVLQLQADLKGVSMKPVLKRLDQLDEKIKSISGQREEMSAVQSINKDDNKVQELEKQLTDVTKSLDNMTKVSREIERERKTELERMHKEHHTSISNLNKQIDYLNQENIRLDSDNIRLNTQLSEKTAFFEKRIEEKDATIKDLQDRLQTAIYDKNGEPWETKTSRRSYRDAVVGNDGIGVSKEAPITIDEMDVQPSPRSINSSEARNDSNVINQTAAKQQPREDIVMLHDSVLNDIVMERLTIRTDRSGRKVNTPTIQDASNIIDDKAFTAKTSVIHVGVNDLKYKPVTQVYDDYLDLARKASAKSNEVVLSLCVPSKDTYLNEKISDFNNMVKSSATIKQMDNLTICVNANFSSEGSPVGRLYKDNIHLSGEGVRVIASNLKRSILNDKTMNYRQDRMRGTGYRNKRTNSTGNSSNRQPRNNYNSYNHYSVNHRRSLTTQSPSRSDQIGSNNVLADNLATAILNVLRSN